MKINESTEKIKVVLSSNIFTRLGQEKISFEINENHIPKVTKLRQQTSKFIPLIHIFNSDEVPEDTFVLINNDEVFYEKKLTEDELNNLGNTIYEQIYLLFNEKY